MGAIMTRDFTANAGAFIAAILLERQLIYGVHYSLIQPLQGQVKKSRGTPK